MKKGLFIVIDGPDGAGKGTMVARAKNFFGDRVVTTREPGGSKYAEEIRQVALKSENAKQADGLTIFLLMLSARTDHLKNTIRTALEAGKTVICDRFDSSTWAYNIVAQGMPQLKEIFWQLRDLVLGDTKPDLYIYLDVDPNQGLSRKISQGAKEMNHFDDRGLDFQNAMRAGFKEFMQKVPHENIDANRPEDEVWSDLQAIMEKLLRQ